MRVTLVSPFDPRPSGADPSRAHVGGVERVYAEVSRSLAARGHDVTVACSTADPGEGSNGDGVRYLRARRRLTVLRAPVARLAPLVSGDADLVQVPATYPFTTRPVLARARSLGVASVLDFHFEPAPTTRLGRSAAGLYRRIGPRAYSWAEAVLVRSLAYARGCPSLASVPEERWRPVPNGIDPERFHPMGSGSAGDGILFVGRLVPYKGLHVLLHALAATSSSPPLIVAGDGPLRSRLEALARQLGVDAHFLGHVSDDLLPTLYRSVALTVLPSVTPQEAFGITLLESMACGTPVVASSLPGVEEIARLGGRVATPGDPVELACEIDAALSDATLARGYELARRIHSAYSWDAVTDRLLAVYREVLEGRAPTPGTRRAEVRAHADPRRHTVL